MKQKMARGELGATRNTVPLSLDFCSISAPSYESNHPLEPEHLPFFSAATSLLPPSPNCVSSETPTLLACTRPAIVTQGTPMYRDSQVVVVPAYGNVSRLHRTTQKKMQGRIRGRVTTAPDA